MQFKLGLVSIFAAATLSACVTTNTVPLTPDTFQLDTAADGLIFTNSAGSDTLLKAAQITQQKGYAYFTIVNSASGANAQYAGTSVNMIGRSIFASPMYTPTQNISVVVHMLQTPEANAWSVAEVIAKKGKMF